MTKIDKENWKTILGRKGPTLFSHELAKNKLKVINK
jgi:hypothetical protein